MTDTAEQPKRAPTERVAVTVYETATGTIAKVTNVKLRDANLQHLEHLGHGYIETTGQAVIPSLHAVDLATLKIVLRTSANAGDISRKETELRSAHAAEIVPAFDVTSAMLSMAAGDETAKKTALAHVASRALADKKLAGLLASLKQSKTLDDISRITWA